MWLISNLSTLQKLIRQCVVVLKSDMQREVWLNIKLFTWTRGLCLEMFTNFDNQGIIVSECNMIENVLRSYDGNNPAMIYTRDASIEISNCFISGTKISDNLKLAIKEAYYKDYSSVTIKLVNFSVWGFEHNQEGDCIRENVNLRYVIAHLGWMNAQVTYRWRL